jgi:3'-phosphoadenosine 5'-phosphosulfate sulfotransferase (PAPS reductase)/FAD synthetase
VPVLLLISGGVDSTVAGAFLLKSLDPEQVYLLYIDTGLMRKAENEEVMRNPPGSGPATSRASMPRPNFWMRSAVSPTPNRSATSSGTCS